MSNAAAERLDPERLIEQACELAGSDDFGDDDGWRENLARLIDDLVSEADLSPIGVEVAAADVILPLRNRLQITNWRRENPDVARQKIERPIVIIGQPRTGTTILYDLLAQDPALRHKMGARSAAVVEERFSVREKVSSLSKLYNEGAGT